MSREYEIMYILDGDIQEEEYRRRAGEVDSEIEKAGGTIIKTDLWGRKRLAYEIKGCSWGSYVLTRFSTGSPKTVSRLEHYCKIHEDILRWMISRAVE